MLLAEVPEAAHSFRYVPDMFVISAKEMSACIVSRLRCGPADDRREKGSCLVTFGRLRAGRLADMKISFKIKVLIGIRIDQC
jgi:hypothetical protein